MRFPPSGARSAAGRSADDPPTDHGKGDGGHHPSTWQPKSTEVTHSSRSGAAASGSTWTRARSAGPSGPRRVRARGGRLAVDPGHRQRDRHRREPEATPRSTRWSRRCRGSEARPRAVLDDGGPIPTSENIASPWMNVNVRAMSRTPREEEPGEDDVADEPEELPARTAERPDGAADGAPAMEPPLAPIRASAPSACAHGHRPRSYHECRSG